MKMVNAILIVGIGVCTALLFVVLSSAPTPPPESYHVTPTYFIDDRFQPPLCYAAFAKWLGNPSYAATAFTAVPCTEGVLERIAKGNK